MNLLPDKYRRVASTVVGDTFTTRASGNIGHEILNTDGQVVAWTTDPWMAQVIARLLCQALEEGLLT